MKFVEKLLPDGTKIKVYEYDEREQRAIYNHKNRAEYLVPRTLVPEGNRKDNTNFDPVEWGKSHWMRKKRR